MRGLNMALASRLFCSITRQQIEKTSGSAVKIGSNWFLSRKKTFSSADQVDKNQRLFSEINVEIKSSDEAVLGSYSQFMKKAAQCLNINATQVVLPTNVEKYTLIKSPHIYKKHRVQYEIRTHRLLLQFEQLTGETADVFLEYIQRNCPEGVSMDVQQVALEELFLNIPPEAQKFLETQNVEKPVPS